jgi:hypothetical protein
MPTDIDRVGDFQACIYEYGLQEYDSGAVAIAAKATISAMWNPDAESWDDWTSYDVEALGYLFIVKKDGTVNDKQVDALVNHCGWDGNIASIINATWQPTPCQVKIAPNTYNGETTYRISFLNAFDRVPGGSFGNVDVVKAKELEARHGAALRAIVGNAKRGTAPPNGKSRPASPPKAHAAAASKAEVASAKDDLPF